MHESVVDPQPAPNSADLAAENRRRTALKLLGIAAVIAAAAVFSLCAGRYGLSIADILDALLHPNAGTAASNVVWHVRLPRILLALLAGGGLALSGAAFQALFANPLAAPDTLGVATGASFGAVLAILFGLPAAGIQMGAVLSGAAAILLVMLVSRTRPGESGSILMIVLSGMVVGALFTAFVGIVKFAADPQDALPSITFWIMGSLTGAGLPQILACLPLLVIGSAVLLLLRWRLNILALPADEAASFGVNTQALRWTVILAATVVTASVVSICGLIGWVGLLVPHAARMLFGSANERVLPACLLLGGLFLLLIDTAARSLSEAEIPVSILTAIAVPADGSVKGGRPMQIEVRNGAFHYPNGKSVLQSVNFSFDGRGVFAVLGPNGAGKTTLLKCLLGLLPWSSGASFFNGRDRREWSTREFWRRTAYVPQARASAFAPLTLRELVVLGRSARIGAFSQPSRTDWTACDHAMELVGIRVLAERLTTEVSGGQLQLAYIARALAAEPELLVLDEPESSLDFKNQAAVLNVIDQLTSSGLGVILNTHFPAHALARAASGILVPQGKPPIFGTAAELFSEAKLSALFGIDVRIRTLDFDGRQTPVVAAVS